MPIKNFSTYIGERDGNDEIPVYLHPRTAGEIANSITPFDYRYKPGNVMRYGAVADGVTDCLTAFNAAILSGYVAAQTRGWKVTVPAGVFKLSDTLHIERSIVLEGAGSGSPAQYYENSTLLFPANKTGIVLWASRNAGRTSSDRSIIRDLCVRGTLSGSTSGNGIEVRSQSTLERVTVRDFKGIGIRVTGGSSDYSNPEETWGSCNLFVIDNCETVANGSHGLYVFGPDANAGNVHKHNSKSNGGWNFYDHSYLGNTYIGCHANDGRNGSYKDVTGSTFIMCYTENSQSWGIEVSRSTIIIGGFMAAAPQYPQIFIDGDGSTDAEARAYCSGGAITNIQIINGGAGYTTATAEADDTNSANVHRRGGSGTGAVLGTPVISGGKIVSIPIINGGSGYEGNGWNAWRGRGGFDEAFGYGFDGRVQIRNDPTNTRMQLLTFGSSNGAAMTLMAFQAGQNIGYLVFDEYTKAYSTTLGASQEGNNVGRRITTPISTAVMTGGRTSGIPPAMTVFPNGAWLGDDASARVIHGGRTAAPTTGEWAQGDFVFNRDPVEAGSTPNKYVVLGWSCVAGGTPGTWLPMRCLTGN